MTILDSLLSIFPFGFLFAHMSFALPVKRLYESDRLVAFYHPRPGYPFHVLLVPKQAVRSLMDLSSSDCALLAEVLKAVQALVIQFDLTAQGYRLIVNGGPNQTVPQLHFHLVSGKSLVDQDLVIRDKLIAQATDG